MQQIKFIDLAAQNTEIRERVDAEFARIHEHTAYIGGAMVAAFEAEFAAFLGARKVVGVGSGTDALRLALIAAGIGPGDEVITTPMTFIATAEAIIQAGARPVFVDIDAQSCNLSVAGVRQYLEAGHFKTTNGPTAVVPVDLYGLPAELFELKDIAARFNLKLIEDACQAHGARLQNSHGWVRAGTVGEAGCFSFYPGKNLGAWGEGGAVATDNEELAARVAKLRDHGRISHYAHDECGYNARLDAIQAAVLRAKLEKLENWNQRRRRVANAYRELLAGCELQLPSEPAGLESCYHLFVIRSPRRDTIREALLKNKIECGIHYPLPLHLQPGCKFLGYRAGEFPEAERLADTALSLPMHPHITDAEVEQVCSTVRAALRGN